MKTARTVCLTILLSTSIQSATLAKIVNHKVVYPHQVVDSELWSEERRNRAEPEPIPIWNPPREARSLTRDPSAPFSEAGVADNDGVVMAIDTEAAPYKAGGKLFFDTPEGPSYCTAEFVGGGKRVLMTAAHCVMDSRGNWYRNWKFFRAYGGGGGQEVHIECISAEDRYYSPVWDLSYDYAFLYTEVESSGGSMGVATAKGYDRLTAIGYPRDHNNGKFMYKVSGAKGAQSGGSVVMPDNRFTYGASGGAWIGGLGNQDQAVGLNSWKRSETAPVNSPVFDATTRDVYRHVKAGSCR